MNMRDILMPGRARIEKAEKTRAREEKRRLDLMIFETQLEAREEFRVFNTPYDTPWLRAVIDKIRAMQIKYAEDGAQDPMGKMANEMASRYAAMGDLEKTLLGLVDKANGEIREDKTGER